MPYDLNDPNLDFAGQAEILARVLKRGQALRQMPVNEMAGTSGIRAMSGADPGAFLSRAAGVIDQRRAEEGQTALNNEQLRRYDELSRQMVTPQADSTPEAENQRQMGIGAQLGKLTLPMAQFQAQQAIKSGMAFPEAMATLKMKQEEAGAQNAMRLQEQARIAQEKIEAIAREKERDRETRIFLKSLGGGSGTADLDRQLKELRIKALENPPPKPLPVGAQQHQRSLQNLESSLGAYEALLKDFDPQSKDQVTDAKRAAIKSAYTDLQMGLKGAYELGAITGPDMEILQGALTDPTSIWGATRGVISGRKPFEAQIGQAKAGLNRSKRNFEQQYGIILPEPAGQAKEPMPGAAESSGFKILGVREK
jgi:hypothetical protein